MALSEDTKLGLTIGGNYIEWNGNKLHTSTSSGVKFLEWIHGKEFTGLALKALISMKYFTFNIFEWHPFDLVPACSSSSSNSLVEFLKKMYIPLGEKYAKSNPCETVFNEWVSSGRLEVFECEFLKLAKASVVQTKIDSLDNELSRFLDYRSLLPGESNIDYLKRLVTKVENLTEKIEHSGCQVPETLKEFNNKSKRQRKT